MVERTIPWWRKALSFALNGIRSGFGLFSKSASSEVAAETERIAERHQINPVDIAPEKNLEEEAALTEPLNNSSPSPEAIAAESKTVAEALPAPEEALVVEAAPSPNVLAADPLDEPAAQAIPEAEPVVSAAAEPAEAAQLHPVTDQESEMQPEAAAGAAEAPIASVGASDRKTSSAAPQETAKTTESPHQLTKGTSSAEAAEIAEEVDLLAMEIAAEFESVASPVGDAEPGADAEPEPEAAPEGKIEPEPVIESKVEPESEPEPEAGVELEIEAESEPAVGSKVEPEPEPEAESEAELETEAEAQPEVDPEPQPEPEMEFVAEPLEMPVVMPVGAEPAPDPAGQLNAGANTGTDAGASARAATSVVPSQDSAPAAKIAIVLKTHDNEADLSPFSVIVDQVYDGPLDLLLDLIRKQDIDIYDIPIAKITAQFLAYVNQLKASDVDVAGEFIYIASLLIHIKSKMLLPRAPSGQDEADEDPRRELVERLLEHERFKNAAQMLQQKQMLEAATWTNPGAREFQDDASAEPEIAADTTDLVRIFRDIIERARNRPIINVQEDSVTVGQMIQFLARRLTMEDKPVALRRLLSHTRSERALIAMFLALLELVRLQAILLRQDRHFSEIFIKKHTGFDSVMDQGLANARDDWR
jgi:segregation and condensation protein A